MGKAPVAKTLLKIRNKFDQNETQNEMQQRNAEKNCCN